MRNRAAHLAVAVIEKHGHQPSRPMIPRHPNRNPAFSLVEVVLAVGIFAFVAVALIGLFSFGLKLNRESVDEMEATALAQAMLNARKAAPTNSLPNCALPRLDQAAEIPPSSPVYISADGSTHPSAINSRFGMVYRIAPQPSPSGISSVYLCLFWPSAAGANKAQGRCEIISTVALP